MDITNPKYKNQGIHVISCIFTVEKGITKVLLIKRKNEPFKDMWALVGGAVYNDETVDEAMDREILEKVGIKDIKLTMANVFSRVERSPVMRMIAISYLGIIDFSKVKVLKNTLKTSDADWVDIKNIPSLAYDHNEILEEAIDRLKEEIVKSDILKSLFPKGFTIPEIQKTYESILGITFDRRNFRRKLLSLDLIEDTKKEVKFAGKKPAKFYKFKENKNKNKGVL